MNGVPEYDAVLSLSPLFAGMDQREREEAVSLMEGKTAGYRKGEPLHLPETPFSSFGLVLSGSVRVFEDDRDGNRILMAEVRPGGTFGESLCFLSVSDSPVYVRAAEDTGILWLSPAPLFRAGGEQSASGMRKRFAALLAARTLKMNSRIQILSRLTIREKLSVFFSELAHEQESETITVPFDREDMAAYIGAERSALSRTLSEMKREGLIDYRKNIFFLKK